MARRPVLTSRPRSARFSLPLREAELLTAGVTPVGTPRLAVGAAGVESDQVAAAWSRTDAVAGLLFMGGMRRSEIAAIRWAAVAGDPGGDGILVTVRRSKTNQGGETNDVRFVKDGVLRGIRTLRAATSPEPGDRVVPLSAQMIGLRFTAAAAGIERRVTANSGRVGLASELTSSGASTTDVSTTGTRRAAWSSPSGSASQADRPRRRCHGLLGLRRRTRHALPQPRRRHLPVRRAKRARLRAGPVLRHQDRHRIRPSQRRRQTPQVLACRKT